MDTIKRAQQWLKDHDKQDLHELTYEELAQMMRDIGRYSPLAEYAKTESEDRSQ